MSMRFLLSVVIFSISSVIFAQTDNLQVSLDSLANELNRNNLDDTSRINILFEIGQQTPIFRLGYWDTLSGLTSSKLDLASDPKVIRALKYSLAGAYSNMGYLHRVQGDIPLALSFDHQSLKIKEELHDTLGMAISYGNIGVVHYAQNEPDLALKYFENGLAYSNAVNDQEGVATSYNYIGAIYRKRSDFKKSLQYFEKSLAARKKIGDERGIAESYNNISSIYIMMDSVSLALEYCREGLFRYEKIGDREGVAFCYNNIGSYLLLINQIADARDFGMKGLGLSQELGFPAAIKNSAGLLYDIAKMEGNFGLALEMYELHISMSDSINNEQTQKASIREETKHEFEKAALIKKQEAAEAARVALDKTNRRNNLQYSVILICILLVFGGVISLGFIDISSKVAEWLIFFSFLILFEFLLVLADPLVDRWSDGAPGYKLLFNAILAGCIFPVHAFFESIVKLKLIKHNK